MQEAKYSAYYDILEVIVAINMGDFIDYLLIFLPIFFAVAYFTHELQGNKNAIKGHGSDIEALEVKVDDLQSRIDELEERLKTSKK